jgi:hypothetical protein
MSCVIINPYIVAAPAGEGNDAFTTVLLHMDGTDAGTTFTDSNAGGSAKTFTAAGNAQLDTAEKKFGTASGLFDGTGDYLSSPDHADFDMAGGDFTLELWFNRNGGDGTNRFLLAHDSASEDEPAYRLRLNASNVIFASAYTDSDQVNVTGTTTFTATGWNHVAFVRTGDVYKLFINGTQEGGDQTKTGALRNPAQPLFVGQAGANRFYWNGWLDEIRISKGIARWTANFTPPTEAYS